jgi:type I restriction enzyme S subunit
MGSEWRTTTLGEVIELHRGYDLPSRDRRDGPYPVVSSSGVSGCHDEARAKAPGVVIGRYGTLGEVHYITQDYWPLNTALYVRDFKGNDPKFISYFLRSLDFGAYSDKAAVPGFNRNDLHTAVVLVPPVAEQQHIAGILGALDDKIELNRRMSRTLESMARALFKSWFVDFDPVGDDAQLGSSQSSGEFKRRRVPEGWRSEPLDSLVETLSGGTPSTGESFLWDGSIPWISPKVMTSIHADHSEECVAAASIGNGTRIAPAGSTLIMVRGMGLHREVRVSQARGEVAFSQDVKALVPLRIAPSLLLFALLDAQPELLEKVESSGHGTGRLPTDVFKAYRVALPSLAAQRELARYFDNINDRIAGIRFESRQLARARDILLASLLSPATAGARRGEAA